MKKILYLTYDGLTDPLGQSQILPYLLGLAHKGFEITIVSTEKSSMFLDQNDLVKKILHGSGIQWHWIKYTKLPPVLSTLFDIWKLSRKARKLNKVNAFQIVHCRSYITAFIGLWLKRKYSLKFIFDMRGFYADERVDGNIWKLKNPVYRWVYRYFKRKEKMFIKEADSIVSLTDTGKSIIQKWDLKATEEISIQTIPCCVDEKHFSPENIDRDLQEKLKKEMGIGEDDLILSYLGSIGTWYMLPEMLDFFKVLLKYKPNSKFLFITREHPETIWKEASKKKINREKLLIYAAKRNEVPSIIALSDVSLFFIKPVFSKQASSPTKLAELVSMGIPIICNDKVGDIPSIYAKIQFGALVKEFSEDHYKEIIQDMDQILQIPEEKLIHSAKQLFSLQSGIHKYQSIYQSLLD